MRRGGPPLPPPPMAQLPVVSSPSPSHRCPWRSCLSCRRHRATTYRAAATTLPPIVSPSRLLPVVPRLCCKQNLEHGACTEEVKREKKERKNSQLTFSSGALLPSYMEGRSAGVSPSDVKKRKRKDVTYSRWWRWRWCTGTGISMSWVARGLSTWGGAVHGGAA